MLYSISLVKPEKAIKIARVVGFKDMERFAELAKELRKYAEKKETIKSYVT